MKRNGFSIGLLAALVFLPAARSEAQRPWIHIEVDEHQGSQSKVRVNLPVSVVQIALEAAPHKIVSDGHIRIEHHGNHTISVTDLRNMWRELRDSGESEIVSIEGIDENVSIKRQGDSVWVQVEEHSRRDDESRPDTVHIKVPVTVVDALFSGEGEELNLRDALEELKDQRGEIVIVEGGDADVRIWIDERS